MTLSTTSSDAHSRQLAFRPVGESSGVSRQDGKRPDGLNTDTTACWKDPAVWDVTVVASLEDSYVDRATTGTGLVVETAAERKFDKY